MMLLHTLAVLAGDHQFLSFLLHFFNVHNCYYQLLLLLLLVDVDDEVLSFLDVSVFYYFH
jgi:hypothetical protein